MSREEAIEKLELMRQKVDEETYRALILAIKALEQEQKSGKWIELPKALNPNENPCKCSECGHILSFMNYYPKSNFCPNCGAKMESEDKTDAT